METVSIIIPVFNMEKVLKRCLDSILNQSYSALQIILIDDGSQDNSAEIAKKYAERDSRINYFYQKNQGVSSARNLGIKEAVGTYLMFVDADDSVDRDFVADYVNEAEKMYADFVLGGICFIENGKEYQKLPKVGNYSKKEYLSLICQRSFEPFGYIGNKLIRMNLIRNNSISFREDLHSQEDLDFMLSCIAKSEKIVCIDNCSYKYYYEPPKRVMPFDDLLGNQIKLYQISKEAGAVYEPQIKHIQSFLYVKLYHANSILEIKDICSTEIEEKLLKRVSGQRREITYLIRLVDKKRYMQIYLYFKFRHSVRWLLEKTHLVREIS